MNRAFLISALLLLAAACGGDDVRQVRPQLVMVAKVIDGQAQPIDTRDFGPVPVLNTRTEDVELLNVGRGTLTVRQALIEEAGVPFTIESIPDVIAAGEQKPIRVVFIPPEEKDYEATLRIETDDLDNPLVTVKLVGKGSTRAIMEVEPTAIDFGRVAEGTAAVKTFAIRSKGSADLIVEELVFAEGSSPNFSFVGSSKTPATVKTTGANGLPGQIQLTVKYTAPVGATGSETGSIRIRGTDPEKREVTIALTASINQAPLPKIEDLGNGAPGMVVNLNGSNSSDPDNDLPLTYKWTLRQKPLGSTTTISPPDSATPSMTLDPSVPGEYEVQLEVTDAAGAKSLVPARKTIIASPAQKLLIEMFWNNQITDLDLHVTRVNTADLYSADDCYYGNKKPDWGVAGDATDDPSYERDALKGYGPEVVGYVNPIDSTYRVHVVFANNHLQAPPASDSEATVRVYEFGVLRGEFKKVLKAQGERWAVADITWPSGVVTQVP